MDVDMADTEAVGAEHWNESGGPGVDGGDLLEDLSNYMTVQNVLHRYIVPVIILTGVVGNTISFVVFTVSPLKRIPTAVYLAALSFSDTGFLFFLAIGWLETFGVGFFHKEGMCQLTVYTSFVFSFTSIWFVNAFTMEMYVTVFHPRKIPRLCRTKTAVRIVTALSVVAGLIYVYTLFITKLVKTPLSENKVCLVVPEDTRSAMIFACLDTVLTLVVPFSMVIFMITRLLIHITRLYKTDAPDSGANSGITDTSPSADIIADDTPVNESERQATEAQTKLVRMLVVTVLVFLVLNVPSHAIKVQFLFRSYLSEHVQFTETEAVMQLLFQTLYYMNFATNFMIYSISGRAFRSALMRVCTSIYIRTCHRAAYDPRLRGNGGALEVIKEEDNVQHSRLVDIHLKNIRFSQLPSMDSQFVYQSPPCLLNYESTHSNLLREDGAVVESMTI